jgi:hypothetical protein
LIGINAAHGPAGRLEFNGGSRHAETRQPLCHRVTATGTVNPELTIIVASYVSGVIQAVVDQNKANLAVAKRQLEKDKAGVAASHEAWAGLAGPGHRRATGLEDLGPDCRCETFAAASSVV